MTTVFSADLLLNTKVIFGCWHLVNKSLRHLKVYGMYGPVAALCLVSRPETPVTSERFEHWLPGSAVRWGIHAAFLLAEELDLFEKKVCKS